LPGTQVGAATIEPSLVTARAIPIVVGDVDLGFSLAETSHLKAMRVWATPCPPRALMTSSASAWACCREAAAVVSPPQQDGSTAVAQSTLDLGAVGTAKNELSVRFTHDFAAGDFEIESEGFADLAGIADDGERDGGRAAKFFDIDAVLAEGSEWQGRPAKGQPMAT
jgi:hypothetical protein